MNAGDESQPGGRNGRAKTDAHELQAARRAFVRALGLESEPLSPHLRAVLEALGEEVMSLRRDVDGLRRALEAAEMLADHDTLCPVFNRRAFLRELRREIALAARFGTPLTLIFVDLDNFKQVNDRFGHATGDEVLQKVAALLREQTRETDVIGRLGGDEFGIALAHADREAGERKAQDLAARIDRLVVRSAGAPGTTPVRLGASCGVASWQRGWSPQTLISEADAAMFSRKSRRRRVDPPKRGKKRP